MSQVLQKCHGLLFPSKYNHSKTGHNMPSLSHFGRINLAITWTVTSLGFFSISICLVRSIFILRKFHLSDGSNTLAFVVGIVLVSQSTWATVLEDGKDHQMEFSDDKIQILAKVNPFVPFNIKKLFGSLYSHSHFSSTRHFGPWPTLYYEFLQAFYFINSLHSVKLGSLQWL